MCRIEVCDAAMHAREEVLRAVRSTRRDGDLRWQRSERNLMSAFALLPAQGPAMKFTVTALVKEVDMDKSTFDLHHPDVRSLAQACAAQVADELVDEVDARGPPAPYLQ
ncbi:hypothetical protein I6B53_02710 [Schaalia sp. 19OD2882]|uniref:hypothetical protein n=1 Tax=Schaalia sp. 19OD2882 TaxID=2794089 RepID=UPI001C1EB3F6|nr:hypothetical protein [Schaalia sp. 19OD2882]QWW20035.1 hypothetical protein I6B53_02710 [Schaalia sp. 19OD2882]